MELLRLYFLGFNPILGTPLPQHLIRSLATRGELVPIYQKAKEKAAEAEKRKKEKGKA